MKPFLVYTVLRLGLFMVTMVVLSVVTVAIFGDSGTVWIFTLVGAAVISSLLSLKFLAGPRERFAQHVDARARRATARFEEIKSREDVE